MLRHFKMTMLKRRQEELANSEQSSAEALAAMPTDSNAQLAPVMSATQPLQQQQQQQHRHADIAAALSAPAKKSASGSRSRRASKPQMEKRRRARINECLDILKAYVLTDSTNLAHLGIDPAASENQDEETIARTILKSSGLIHRHRGRKNPNKLEKADILELTVDYVRRLYDQRNKLLLDTCAAMNGDDQSMQNGTLNLKIVHSDGVQLGERVLVPAHLSEPLTLDLSPKSRVQQHAASDLLTHGHPRGAPLTPPPSSASSIQSTNDEQQLSATPQITLSRVLNNYKLYDVLAHQ